MQTDSEQQTPDAEVLDQVREGEAPIVEHADPNAQRVAVVDPLPDPQQKIFGDVDLNAETNSFANLYSGFDPQIHAANEDGTPKLKKDGTYALKRGRKSGAISAPSSEADLPAPVDKPAAPEAAKKINYKNLGQVYAGLFFGGTASIIGPEWMPRDNDEKKNVENAFAAYAEHSGAQDLPPGIALVLTLGMYSAARFQHENTKSKFGKIKDKAMNLFYWAKGRFTK